jgi:hypothetical protein
MAHGNEALPSGSRSECDMEGFSGDVQRYASSHQDKASVNFLQNKISISSTGNEEDILLTPCLPEKRSAYSDLKA